MVGVLQVLVYAGAIMVLFLFVIMFLKSHRAGAAAQTVVGIRFAGWRLLLAGESGCLYCPMADLPADPVAATEIFGSPETLAKSLFTDFVLPFEIASVLLLVAIIGAVVLAKREP